MPVVQNRARRLSTSSNTDDLHAEIETLQAQLDTTQSNLGTLRGTNNRLTDRIQKLEAQIDDNAVHVQTQEKDINSLRRQLRISGAEITRLRTEREVLEKDYESVNKDVIHEREERRKLMDKISELEEQVASALHLHVVSSSRVPGSSDAKGEGEQKAATSWLDLKAKLREAENELDAVQQERDWLEGQLEKFIHAKDSLDSNFSIKNLRSRTSMSSIADSARSFGSSSRRSSTSSHTPANKQSLGQELGLEWNGEYDSDAESDESGGSDSTERADNESEVGVEPATTLSVPRIIANDGAAAPKDHLKDFALRLDTSGQPYRGRSRAPSFASSHRAPSIAASVRSRMSTRSLRPGSRLHDFDDVPPPPVTATAVFHEIERQHDAKVSRLQNDIVTLSTDLQGEIEILQEEVNAAREERDVCVLEIQRLSTELNVTNARHEDAISGLEASLAAAMVAAAEAKQQAILEPPPPAQQVVENKPVKEMIEIGIQTDEYEPETIIREVVREVIRPVVVEEEEEEEEEDESEEEEDDEDESEEEVEEPQNREELAPSIAPIAPVEEPAVPEVVEPPVSHFSAALEAELAALREQDQTRVADNLKLKSEVDILTRDLREKDTLLRAEVIRLERDLDELVRDNRNMKDDAEINHYKVENLADELDRTRELLQIQASERREFMEELEQLQVRNRELELQLRIRRATPSPVPPSSLHETLDPQPTARFNDLAPFMFPLKDSSSAKSDFEDTLDSSDNDFALISDSESDVPPPPPLPIKHKRRKSSSGKHKRHHSKKERKREKGKEKEEEELIETPKEPPKEPPTPRKHSVSKLPQVSKIPTVSKIPSANKSNRKSMTLPRSVAANIPAALKAPRSPSPITPIEPQFERQIPRTQQEQPRIRSSTLPMKIPRPSISFRGPQLPADPPPPDKTYWKDLMVGGYAMQPQEYNKHRRDMRNMHKNMQIKVTAKGVETKGRVGTGAGFGVGNYADQPELKPISKKKIPKRRTSFSDDEAYTHKERGSWLSGMFRK
ncbi:hypothetical protein ABW20_dc0106789 [Dactylellina cionopaga]|nr:hypothetical protein ABW20_dc0106789 [Dactylellina cionopaga]